MNDSKERFDALADAWRAETGFHSNNAIIMRHPAIQSIISMGQQAIPMMLERWRDQGGLWHHALAIVTGVRITDGIQQAVNQHDEPIPGWVSVNQRTLRQAWLNWEVENGHIETTESKPQTTTSGYELRRYAQCESPKCQDERERVYRCPLCTLTFCNDCADILHWEAEHGTVCPKCGGEPPTTGAPRPKTEHASGPKKHDTDASTAT